MSADYFDDGYWVALKEMVGEMAVLYTPSMNPSGAYVFPAHTETKDEALEKENLARLLYYVIRSDPLHAVVRAGLVGVVSQHARLWIVIEMLIKLTGHSLCTEIVVAANVLLYQAYLD